MTNMSTTHIYMRMAAYILTIVMHVTNITYLGMNYQNKAKITEDPYMEAFGKLQARFFTCWTFGLQVIYAVTGLICDRLILKNSSEKSYKLPKYLKGFRDTLFSAVIWPSTWVVFLVFWVLFNYDRSLIYPAFVDKVLTSLSNHIMHTAIVPIILWELYFQPRSVPRSHKRNLYHLASHFAIYFSVLIYTYIERDVWLYPIFKLVYGTIYFPITLAIIFGLALGAYYLQWELTKIVWNNKNKVN